MIDITDWVALKAGGRESRSSPREKIVPEEIFLQSIFSVKRFETEDAQSGRALHLVGPLGAERGAVGVKAFCEISLRLQALGLLLSARLDSVLSNILFTRSVLIVCRVLHARM